MLPNGSGNSVPIQLVSCLANLNEPSAAYDKRTSSLTQEEQEGKNMAKRKMLGNIKFIAELGKVEMLHDSILHRCAEQLLVSAGALLVQRALYSGCISGLN
jgi:translation initiation factor 4G